MAEKKFSELPSAASLTGNELAALSQMQSGSLASVKSTLQAIANWFAVYAQYTTALQTTDKSIAGAINELKQLISLIPQFSIEVVQVLPTEDISDTTIYLVPAEDPEVGNYYEEYIYVNNTWELVGTTAVDLSAYYTKLEVDGLLADKLEADDFEANQTASANPITLETKQAGLAKSFVVSFGPIQDLHGYSNPWAGGAGKNKCPNLAPYSGHGLTITVSDYGEIIVNGTPDTSISLFINLPTLSSGDYTISANNNTTIAQSNTYIECLDANDTRVGVAIYNAINAHFSVNGVPARIKLNFDPRATFTNFILKIQLESGSTVTDFAPYSNICPISGRTEASVNQGSVDITTLYNGQIQSAGNFTWNNNRISNANSSQMNTYFLKKGTHTLTFNKLNQSAPDLVKCTVLTKNDNFEIVDNFATTWHSLPYTFELTADAYVYFTARKDYETALNTADYKTLIIDEAHTKEFGQTVYGGSLDLLNGKLTIEWLSKIITSVNSIGGSGTEASPYFFRILLSSSEIGVNTAIENNQPIASYFKPDNTSSHVLGGTFLTSNGGTLHITFADQSIDTTAKANTYLTENPLQVAYKLATPTTIQLSPEALTLLKGLNVISTDGDKVQVEFSDIPVGDYSALLDYVKSLEARIQALEG